MKAGFGEAETTILLIVYKFEYSILTFLEPLYLQGFSSYFLFMVKYF